QTAARYGVAVDGARADWPAIRDRVETVIDTIRGGDGDANIRRSGVALYKDHARFRSPHEIEVDGDVLRFDRAVIATGARAVVPPIPGLAEAGFITNVEAVALERLPRSLAIIGGGVVATEFAQIFGRLGVEVTILNRRERILPREEPELTEELQDIFRREGIRIENGIQARRVERAGGLARIDLERDGAPVRECGAETILLATGRAPVVDDLGLDAAGVAYSKAGVEVDAMLRTTAPNIWAAGDVIAGGFPFTHVADYQARIVAANVLGHGRPREVDYAVVPWGIFTDPELGRVGLTEAEARATGCQVRVARTRFRDIARGIAAGETDGLVKLVADRVTGRLLGAHILGARGAELLGEAALAIRLRLPAGAIADTLHAYPSLSEGVFWTALELSKPESPLMEAVRGVQM
ncbi:MAG TPA: FAD-dependent oxidoreductase, partial [Thermomicrobiales bacterium]|nr:FAD-dependent oxidoreductase [Thermomicrobiales bacterium]